MFIWDERQRSFVVRLIRLHKSEKQINSRQKHGYLDGRGGTCLRCSKLCNNALQVFYSVQQLLVGYMILLRSLWWLCKTFVCMCIHICP